MAKRNCVEIQMRVLIDKDYIPDDVPAEQAGRTRGIELLEDMDRMGWQIEAYEVTSVIETEFDDGMDESTMKEEQGGGSSS